MVKGVELNLKVDVLGRQSRLVNVEGLGTLVRCHALVNDRVQADLGLDNID